jgi:hypothetical protein
MVQLLTVVSLLAACRGAWAQPRVIDDFAEISGWSAVTSDGVALRLSGEQAGPSGGALRLDFDFARGSGYCIARKQFSLPIPENYRFLFDLRGEAPPNTLEFKLVDPTGDNVWWVNRRRFEFPREWTTQRLPARQFSFAWGPAAGKPLGEARSIELAITAATGGRGTVWISNLRFEPLAPVRPYSAVPVVSASSRERGESAAPLSLGAGGRLDWRSAPDDVRPRLAIDFVQTRQFGGLVIDWDPQDFGVEYCVEGSSDGTRWDPLASVRASNGGRDFIATRDAEWRFLRIVTAGASRARGVGIRAIDVRPPDFSASWNAFLAAAAADAPEGRFPKYLRGRQTYWTLVGVSGDDTNGVMNEEGAIEVARESFSIEPFIFGGQRLITWADASVSQSLARGYLPLPAVRWDVPAAGLRLEVSALADGAPGSSAIWARYRVTNTGSEAAEANLFLAIRPLQVCPPWQNLNMTGGFAPVRTIAQHGAHVGVNDAFSIVPMTPGAAFGASPFHSGDITEFLVTGIPPVAQRAEDPDGLASGALAFPLRLAAGEHGDIVIAVPLHSQAAAPAPSASADLAAGEFERRHAAVCELWERELSRTGLRLPPAAARLGAVLRTSLAYILINRDGVAIRPGTRTYARTWIRDGSLTSAALLSFGFAAEVRDFLDWFAPHQYESGKIPCVVDRRGPDPVPENDSHGEYIYAVLNCYRFTGDAEFLRRQWPHVAGAVRYIEFLRAQRMTGAFAGGDALARACYGLVPESISHEGYSAKPMHSYWDDFFTLKGLEDAATIAEILGEAEAPRVRGLRDSFRETLGASLRAAMALKGIDYIPGCVELGDFDATSTAIALFPCGQLGRLPEPQLRTTFERYYRFFKERRDGGATWDGYTPYETRLVGALVRLGQRERALELIDYFLEHQRPRAWNHWAEVVWRDAAKPAFIGDMPHTWVASDFINAIRTLFVYERDADGALVLLAGVPEAWLRAPEGLSISGWPTHAGPLSYDVSREGGDTVIRVPAGPRVPGAGIVVLPPRPAAIERVLVDGQPRDLGGAGELVLRSLPAEVRLTYR